MSFVSALLKIKEYHGDKAVSILRLNKSTRETMANILDDGKGHVFATVVLNKILGRVILFTDLEDKDVADGKTVCYLSNLWVHPKLRGKKFGSKLVRFVEKEAKKKGFEYLALGVNTDDKKNLSIYKHLNFDIVVKTISQSVVAKDKDGNYLAMKEYYVLKKKL